MLFAPSPLFLENLLKLHRLAQSEHKLTFFKIKGICISGVISVEKRDRVRRAKLISKIRGGHGADR